MLKYASIAAIILATSVSPTFAETFEVDGVVYDIPDRASVPSSKIAEALEIPEIDYGLGPKNVGIVVGIDFSSLIPDDSEEEEADEPAQAFTPLSLEFLLGN